MPTLPPPLATALAAAALCVCAAAATYAQEPPQSINKIAAIVNDDPITLLEIEREARRLRQNDATLPPPEARQTALDNLIDRRLQLQRARLSRIAVPDAALEVRLVELQQQFELPDEAALRQFAQDRFLMSYDKFRERVREDMQIQSLFYREVFSRTQTYEDEVDQFLKSQAGIGNLREYHLRHILISVAADGSDIDTRQELALSIRASAAAGADFAALARAHSNDEGAEAGGNLGYKKESELPAAFIAEVQNLAAGEVSQVIPTSRGFHLLYLERQRGGDLRESVRTIRLSHIFFSEDDLTLATQVRANIATVDDFTAAVRRHSIDEVSLDRGGDIGWFEEKDIPPYFIETAKTLKKGAISAPVSSPFGWHILYMADEKIEQFDIQRLRDQARQLLREQRALAQREVWLRRLRSAAHVRILDTQFTHTIR